MTNAKKEVPSASLQNAIIALGKRIQKQLRHAIKKKEKAISNLQTCQKWSEMHQEGLLLQSSLYLIKKGMEEIILQDWDQQQERRIQLDPLKDPYAQVKMRFHRSKRLKSGIPKAERFLKKSEEECAHFTQLLQELNNIQTEAQLTAFSTLHFPPQSAEVLMEKKALPYREFFTQANLSIWVGKSAKDNEKLSFTYAKGSDWWLHTSDVPGSHVVLRVQKNQIPDDESLKDAIQLALHYSKAKGEGNVCITQCKYLSRPSRAKTGTVFLSKQKIVYARLDRSRIERLQMKG